MLSFEEQMEIAKRSREQVKEFHKESEEIRIKELEKQGIIIKSETDDEKERNFHGDCDHPNTMENGQATIFYILVMLGGLIFNDRWLIWTIATIIYLKFITRHKK